MALPVRPEPSPAQRDSPSPQAQCVEEEGPPRGPGRGESGRLPLSGLKGHAAPLLDALRAGTSEVPGHLTVGTRL